MTPSRGRGSDGSYFPKSAPRRPGSGPWRAKGKRPFGDTWWGRAWIEALEQRARLDPNRLPRGRTYARTGAVGALEVRRGEVRSSVQGSRSTPYKVVVRVRTFSTDEWERALELLSSEVGHVAALLDGELSPAVGEQLRAAGLDLLPGAGEVAPKCSCPDWAEPCKHSAATCYLVADLLDEDPFQLFYLRGLGRQELLAALRARRAAAAAAAGEAGGGLPGLVGILPMPPVRDGPDAGVPAREAWARAATLPNLPPLPLPPPHPGKPAVLGVDPPRSSGISAEALRMLASDAAGRAFELAHGSESSGLELSFREDVARRAAKLLEGGPAGLAQLPAIAGRVGLSGRELMCFALAWQAGGRESLFVLLETWDPPAAEMEQGRALIRVDALVRISTWHNRVSLADRQLRLGRDGRWYPYRRAGRTSWQPDGAALTR
jgi:uncharacterized Zn finger protein